MAALQDHGPDNRHRSLSQDNLADHNSEQSESPIIADDTSMKHEALSQYVNDRSHDFVNAEQTVDPSANANKKKKDDSDDTETDNEDVEPKENIEKTNKIWN